MKKAVLIRFIFTASLSANAQKLLYGVKVSAGFAYQKVDNKDILTTSSCRTFNIRGIAQLPLAHGYWLEGGLGIAGKGSIVYNDALTTTTRLTYLELPVNILRKFKFTNLGVFYLGAGGYLAKGLGGRIDYETPGSNTNDNLKFGKANDVRQLDAGLNISSGFEFRNRLTFNMMFSLGLNNIASDSQQDSGTPVVKNREFSIGLGYLF
jgi:hypothetical protein